MGCCSFPWDAGDPPPHEDVASRSTRTLIIMRQGGRECHVPGVAADQATRRDDKLMVVLLVVSAVCCERGESDENLWRVSEAGGEVTGLVCEAFGEICKRGKRDFFFLKFFHRGELHWFELEVVVIENFVWVIWLWSWGKEKGVGDSW